MIDMRTQHTPHIHPLSCACVVCLLVYCRNKHHSTRYGNCFSAKSYSLVNTSTALLKDMPIRTKKYCHLPNVIRSWLDLCLIWIGPAPLAPRASATANCESSYTNRTHHALQAHSMCSTPRPCFRSDGKCGRVCSGHKSEMAAEKCRRY